LINIETSFEASADVVNGLRAVHEGTTRRSCPTKAEASRQNFILINLDAPAVSAGADIKHLIFLLTIDRP